MLKSKESTVRRSGDRVYTSYRVFSSEMPVRNVMIISLHTMSLHISSIMSVSSMVKMMK